MPAETAPTDHDLASLFRDHAAFVWRVLKRHGVQPRDLEDAVQEVFLVVHRKLPEFQGRSSVRTWLYSISAALSRRHAHVQRELLIEADERAVAAEQPGHVERKQLLTALDDALAQLSEDQRAVFVLFEIEDWTLAEIAGALGIPLSTVSSRVYRARANVERILRRTLRTEEVA